MRSACATKKCRNFNGFTNHTACKVGVDYKDAKDETSCPYSSTCFGENDLCGQYNPYTPEELAQQDAETKRRSELIRQGVSPCCEAAIDISRVVTSGRYAGHGSRYCSKCGGMLFTV